jgi:hypothetical protein
LITNISLIFICCWWKSTKLLTHARLCNARFKFCCALRWYDYRASRRGIVFAGRPDEIMNEKILEEIYSKKFTLSAIRQRPKINCPDKVSNE